LPELFPCRTTFANVAIGGSDIARGNLARGARRRFMRDGVSCGKFKGRDTKTIRNTHAARQIVPRNGPRLYM
jgi:hypothetical protein